MTHYGIQEWADYARGLTPALETSAMQGHLGEGCPECRDMAGFFASLSTVCREMATCSVPESVVRNARSIFPAPQPRPAKRALRLRFELIYDSFLTPVPVGLRSSWQRGWQALYRAGDCSLDLRVEPETHSTRAAVIGQISNHAQPKSRMEGLPVYVRQGRVIVAETRSNEFGEFQMEYEQRGRLQLCVDLENGSRRLQVPLRRLIAESAAGLEKLELPTSEPDSRVE